MAQLVVRNIESTVKTYLQRRARRNGRSMEEEVREILRNATLQDDAPAGGLGSEIAALFAKTGLAKTGLTSDIPELRGHTVEPAAFEP
jgi:plasmid stability protein